jgi:hypothetical protein
VGGEVCEHGEGLEPVTVRSGGLSTALGASEGRVGVGLEVPAERHVVRDDELVQACSVGGDGPVDHGVPPAGVLGGEGDHLD